MFNGKSSTADKVMARLPEGMRERIAEIAKSNHRSMNTEIVIALTNMIDDVTQTKGSGKLARNACEARVLEAFRKLPKAKQKAVMALMAGEQ